MVHAKDAQLKLAAEQLRQRDATIQALHTQLDRMQQQQQQPMHPPGLGQGSLEVLQEGSPLARAPSTGDSFSDFIMSDAFDVADV